MSENQEVNISDEAVEAAILAYMGCPQTRGINMFRAAVEAAAPYIAAQAWDEGWYAADLDSASNPYRSAGAGELGDDYNPHRNGDVQPNPYRSAGAGE